MQSQGVFYAMHIDLLTNPINCGWAVNVELSETEAVIGGFYLTENMPGRELPLESGSVTTTLILPEELENNPEPFRAWNITLQVKEE